MKREAVILFLLFTLSKLVVAADVVWYDGSVVLDNKSVHQGKISIEHDLVLLKSGEHVDVLPAHKLQSVFYYDQRANINRRLVSIQGSSFFERARLYEIVLIGNASILRRSKTGIHHPQSDALDFEYFTMVEEKLVPLNKFRKKVFPTLLNDAGLALKVYVKENRLNPNVSANAIRITQQYNVIKKSEQLMASQ